MCFAYLGEQEENDLSLFQRNRPGHSGNSSHRSCRLFAIKKIHPLTKRIGIHWRELLAFSWASEKFSFGKEHCN